MGMGKVKVDPCVLVKHDKNGTLEGIVFFKLDDIQALGTTDLREQEDMVARHFKSNPRTLFTGDPQLVNRKRLRRMESGDIIDDQPEKILKLSIPKNEKEISSHRAMEQYVGVNCRPEVCSCVQLVAPGSEPKTKEDLKSFNRAVTRLRNTCGTTRLFRYYITSRMIYITLMNNTVHGFTRLPE